MIVSNLVYNSKYVMLNDSISTDIYVVDKRLSK